MEYIIVALTLAVVFGGLGFLVGFKTAMAQCEDRLSDMDRVLEPERPSHRQHHNYQGPEAHVRKGSWRHNRRWL